MSHNPVHRNDTMENTQSNNDHTLQDTELSEAMIHTTNDEKIDIDNTLFY